MTKNKAVWLAQLLFRRGRLSREEIFSAWADVDEKGQRTAPSTFYDNRNQLFSRYGIRLRSDHGYYSLDIGGGRERDFLETLLRSEGEGGAPSAIGGRQPAGFDKVAPIARAIEDGMAIGMIYAPYDKPRYSTTFSPYCLRLFRSRLYSVGFSSRHDGLRTFALDRIASLRPSSAPPHRRGNFDPRRYFAHSFGIYGGMDLKSEHIVLLADARSAAFLRSLPLHPSQSETKLPAPEGRYVSTFTLDVSVTDDFVRELFYYASGIRVIAPATLARRITDEARAVLSAYADKPCQ